MRVLRVVVLRGEDMLEDVSWFGNGVWIELVGRDT